MYPVNQVILGGDPMTSNLEDLDLQIKRMEAYKQKLSKIVDPKPTAELWNKIDIELSPLSEDQKIKLFQDSKYMEIYTKLQLLVQAELLDMVKGKIESTKEGKDLLEAQLDLVKKLKVKIIEETNRELTLFTQFKEFSKSNPNVTYEEFLTNLK